MRKILCQPALRTRPAEVTIGKWRDLLVSYDMIPRHIGCYWKLSNLSIKMGLSYTLINCLAIMITSSELYNVCYNSFNLLNNKIKVIAWLYLNYDITMQWLCYRLLLAQLQIIAADARVSTTQPLHQKGLFGWRIGSFSQTKQTNHPSALETAISPLL